MLFSDVTATTGKTSTHLLKFLTRIASLVVALSLLGARAAATEYFDAHNHLSGVLPYYAYADLPAFVASFSNPRESVSVEDRLALYRYLADVWYPAQGEELGDRLFSPADGQRFALGARAALLVYRGEVAGSTVALNGTLERVLTATPWSEFDSAYAFRGGPAGEYLLSRFYAGSNPRMSADLCRATVLDLAATHIDDSEQSVPFVGGWKFANGTSWPLQTIECLMNAPSDAGVRAALHVMSKPIPEIKVVLMTHTSQLATLPGGTQYSEWSKTGACAAVPLPKALVTTPKAIYDALMGWNAGVAVVPPAQAATYFNTVIGIDTAAPETTCFTTDGMRYYAALIAAVYDAARSRRLTGWRGKLLVHTHVGEGAAIAYAPSPPPQPWTFQSVFAKLPPTLSNTAQARNNISILLAAIAQFEGEHPDIKDYVVFRLAHDTWATPEQAQAMHDEGVEADVSLESTVATGAYPIARMPIGSDVLSKEIDPIAQNPATNFQLNDLLSVLVTDPTNVSEVGAIFGDASLKYLLEARVRCLLGTDAAGVEHSDIIKEYQYAASLIAYWNQTEPAFRARSGDVNSQALFDNVRWHRSNMSADRAIPY